jgi:hypothetical protein
MIQTERHAARWTDLHQSRREMDRETEKYRDKQRDTEIQRYRAKDSDRQRDIQKKPSYLPDRKYIY